MLLLAQPVQQLVLGHDAIDLMLRALLQRLNRRVQKADEEVVLHLPGGDGIRGSST